MGLRDLVGFHVWSRGGKEGGKAVGHEDRTRH